MPNILFILLDQLRFDTLGFFGKFPVRTPNIDALARDGTVFDSAYCANPVCVPARASLMTGVYSFDHGVYYNDQNWPERLPTFAEKLAANAYYTTVVGKTHFFPPRRAAGFRKLVVEEDYNEHRARIGRPKRPGTGKTRDADYLNRAYPIEPTDLALEDYITGYFTRRALHELDLLARRRECGPEGNEPFLMKLSFLKPHSPCDQPEPYFSMYRPADLPPPVCDEREIPRFNRHLADHYAIWRGLDGRRAVKHRAQYFGCVSMVDEMIGRVLGKLRDLGLFDNTLVVFTSDHGDMLGDHYLQQKGVFFEPSVRVPLIFAGPGIPKGRRVAENVSHIDLFPTLLEYCDLAMPRRRGPGGEPIYADQADTDARSLMPYFRPEGGAVSPARVIIAENAMRGQRVMLKQGGIKVNYYVNEGAEDEIERYDLAADPDEMNFNCAPCAAGDLEPDLRAALERVLALSRRHAGRHYYFQGRVRPLFT